MARSYKHTPSHGISDSSANHTRRLRRKARRAHNRRVVAFVAACPEAADDAVWMTRQEADGDHWGKGYFGHLMAEGWYKERGAKYLRK
jgi:hypothetical protein